MHTQQKFFYSRRTLTLLHHHGILAKGCTKKVNNFVHNANI